MMDPKGLSFQNQFRILIEAVPAPDGHSFDTATIAQATDLSEQSLLYLLDGRTQNPRLDTLRRLCSFYNVSLDYFACETEANCRAFLARHAAERASPIIREIDQEELRLTPSAKGNVLRLLERFRHLRRSGKH